MDGKGDLMMGGLSVNETGVCVFVSVCVRACE